MRHALTVEQTRAAEEAAVAAGAGLGELMERAGAALAVEVASRAPRGPVFVAAGGGNNGGDGWVAARLLAESGRDVVVVSTVDPAALPEPAEGAFRMAVAAGVPWRTAADAAATALDLSRCTVIVDSLLGIGARGAPRGPVADLIEGIDDADAIVVSADIPSGVGADTGTMPGVAIEADATVTFSALKPGLLLEPGASMAGDVVVAEVGIPERLLEPEGAMECWAVEDYADVFPRPRITDHKYSRGRLLLVGGAPGMTGAVCLAAAGALRAGAGYVCVAVPAPSLAVVEEKLTSPVKVALPAAADGALGPEVVDAVVELSLRADAVVLGPGLGRATGTLEAVRALVERLAVPLVLDADALFALGADLSAVAARSAGTILTPHTGEAARLLDLAPDAVEADRPSAALALAQGGATALLKGPASLIAGAGRLIVNPTGGPGLATLGTGDVLAGIVGALLSQGLQPLDAAAIGAYLHGAAGDAASDALTPVCCSAEDVVAYMPEAVRPLL